KVDAGSIALGAGTVLSFFAVGCSVGVATVTFCFAFRLAADTSVGDDTRLFTALATSVFCSVTGACEVVKAAGLGCGRSFFKATSVRVAVVGCAGAVSTGALCAGAPAAFPFWAPLPVDVKLAPLVLFEFTVWFCAGAVSTGALCVGTLAAFPFWAPLPAAVEEVAVV